MSLFTDAQDLFQSSSEENVSKLPHEIADSDLTFHRQSHDINSANAVQIPKQTSDSNEFSSAKSSIFMPQKQQITHTIPTLIDSDPPDLDDMPSTSASSRNAHKPPNLFLDDDDDDDNDDDFIFDSNKQSKDVRKPDAQSTQQRTPGGTKTNSINLFADEDGNESDNFDSFLPTKSKTAATIPRSSQQKPEPIRNLFDNDDEDDDDELFMPSSSIGTATKAGSNRSTILSNAPKKDVFQYNLFDDKPPDDDDDFESTSSKPSDSTTVQTTPKKATSNLFSTKVNLFAEDDNDDDDDIFEKLITPSSSKKQPIKEDNKNKIAFDAESSDQSIPIAKKPEPTSSSSASNKSSLFNPRGLFDDSPPSDDDENQLFSSTSRNKVDATKKQQPVDPVVKKSTKEFYNDFSETVTAISQADKVAETPEIVQTTKPAQSPEKIDSVAKTSSSEIQSPTVQQPPIEDEPKQKPAPASRNSSKNDENDDGLTTNKRSEFMKKIDAFSNAKVNESKSETSEPVPKARQPKKLNIGSIDINVAALLPGAKRAKSVDKTDNKDHSDDISSSDDTSTASQMTTSTSTAKAISQDNIDSSGRLANLNRNRAKNLSRRPSTRAGRKQHYQKSMDGEEQIDGKSNVVEKEAVSPATDNNEKQNVIEPIDPSPTKTLMKSPTSKVIFEDEDIFETFAPNEDSKESPEVSSSDLIKDDEEPTSEMVTEDDNPFSFLDDKENDENDEFLYSEPKASSSTYIDPIPVKATPAYIDELPPDLEDPIDDKPYDSKSAKETSLSQNALSLFGDDDDDFENDEIFNSDRVEQPPPGTHSQLVFEQVVHLKKEK